MLETKQNFGKSLNELRIFYVYFLGGLKKFGLPEMGCVIFVIEIGKTTSWFENQSQELEAQIL